MSLSATEANMTAIVMSSYVSPTASTASISCSRVGSSAFSPRCSMTAARLGCASAAAA